MAQDIATIAAILGLVVIAGSYFYVRGKKAKSKALAVGLVLAFFGAGFGGLAFAGVPGFLSAAPAGDTGAPVSAALWEATLVATSDTDRTETEIISPDGHTVSYFLVDAQMTGLGNVDLEATVVNLNVGETTDVWGPLEISIVEVGTVIVSGVPTPVANYTADRTRFNIAYSLTTAGAPTLVQIHDKAFSYDWTTGASDTLNIDMPIDPAVTANVPSGGSFKLVYNVGGVILTAFLQEP